MIEPMALEFFVPADGEVFQAQCFVTSAKIFVGGVELGDYDKLEPIWDYCRSHDVQASYFSDFYINADVVNALLLRVSDFEPVINSRRPFYKSEDLNHPYHRFKRVLRQAAQANCGLVALCD